MAERFENDFATYMNVTRQTESFRRWFRIASRNVDFFGIDDDMIRYDEFATEQFFSLVWQQFEAAVVADQPKNMLAVAALSVSDERVRQAFGCEDGRLPWELMED